MSEPKAAASVILMRPTDGPEPQVYLLRRHRKAKFMSSSFVFPGGIADDGEEDPRYTAARELFEESGVLLARDAGTQEERDARRRRLNIDKEPATTVLGDLHLALDDLQYYAHWITPSIEKRRYSARFFLAVLPEGQLASPDNEETVDEVWVTPSEALERADELRLPPPQLRTFYELLEPAKRGIEGIFEFARKLAHTPHPILPRACATSAGVTLLLPWDPDYEELGQGDKATMAADHPLAQGHSRFVLTDGCWTHSSVEKAG